MAAVSVTHRSTQNQSATRIPCSDSCRTLSREKLLASEEFPSTVGNKQSLNRKTLQTIALYKEAKSKRVEEVKVPKSCVPLCSRCGRPTQLVDGATFIRDDNQETFAASDKSPLALWQCSYCKNYEGTRASLVPVLKRIMGKRNGGDVLVKVGRRPTYTRHGKLTIRLKANGGLSYTCYVPVKSHIPMQVSL